MVVRLIGAAAVLASAAIHLRLWLNGVKDQGTVGQLFVVNVVAGVVIAVLLLAWNHWIPAFLAVGFGASTLDAFTISASVGLFGIHEHWRGKYVWGATVTETIAILAGLVLLARLWSLRPAVEPAGHMARRSAGQPQER